MKQISFLRSQELFALINFIKRYYFLIVIVIAISLAFAFIGIFVAKKYTPKFDAPANNGNGEDKEAHIINFLVVGKDDASGLCDVIIVVSYDTNYQKAEVLQIPRDTYASYTTAAYRKINGALYSLGGIQQFVDFTANALGIKIDHYICVDTKSVAKAIDIMGGIEIDIPMDMKYKDPYQDLFIDLKAGTHLLNGKEAVCFLRYRSGYITGDLGRIDAQKIFMSALANKLLKESSLKQMMLLAMEIIDDVNTDLNVSDCIALISSVRDLGLEDIGFTTLPGEAICSESGTWYYIANRQMAYEAVKEYIKFDATESDFDPERLLTTVYRAGFNEIYEAENKYEIEHYTARQLCDGGIKIE